MHGLSCTPRGNLTNLFLDCAKLGVQSFEMIAVRTWTVKYLFEVCQCYFAKPRKKAQWKKKKKELPSIQKHQHIKMKYYYFEQVYRLYIDFERYHKAAYNIWNIWYWIFCFAWYFDISKHLKQYVSNRQFPSCLSPLFQSDSKCEAFHMEISFIHMQMLVHLHMWIKLISIWKASHEDSLWNWGERQLRNCLLPF